MQIGEWEMKDEEWRMKNGKWRMKNGALSSVRVLPINTGKFTGKPRTRDNYYR